MGRQHGIPNGTSDKTMGAMDYERDRVGAPKPRTPRPAASPKFPPKSPGKRPPIVPRKY